MNNRISEVLESFTKLEEEEYNRFNSWRTCFDFFQNIYFEDKGSNDNAALHLGFYLASWGMYRGSTFLLQNDYTIHVGIVQILKEYYSKNEEIEFSTMQDISNEIVKHYNLFAHPNSKKNNTASDTLITKILLGTLGCIPAYDRFFINGLKLQNEFNKNSKLVKKFSQNSVNALNEFYTRNKHEFVTFEEKYPKMKLLDMYFWKLGFDNE